MFSFSDSKSWSNNWYRSGSRSHSWSGSVGDTGTMIQFFQNSKSWSNNWHYFGSWSESWSLSCSESCSWSIGRPINIREVLEQLIMGIPDV